VRRLESERDSARDSAKRAQDAVAEAKAEQGRQSSLMDSLQKIERSFSAKVTRHLLLKFAALSSALGEVHAYIMRSIEPLMQDCSRSGRLKRFRS
jgi:phage regulator Rha-like protein